MRTQIQQTGSNTVRISYETPLFGDLVTREFRVAFPHGYVRDEDGRQVCAGLDRLGDTLEAYPETLIEVVRAEYRRMRRREAAELKRYRLN